MTKKLLKIKIQAKPVLKEGRDDLDKLLLEFAKLSKSFLRGSESAREAKEVFKSFAKKTKLVKRLDNMTPDAKTLEEVVENLTKAVEEVPKVLNSAEDIFLQTLRNPNALNRANDADAVLDGLKAMKKRLAKIAKVEGLNRTSKRKAIETIKKIEAKINVIEGLRDSSISYLAAAAKRTKKAGKTVDEIVDTLPDPTKVKPKFAGSKYATETKEFIEATGKEGAEQAAKEGSKWRKWLSGAGLLVTALGIYKALETDTADAEDKKAVSKPGRGTSRGTSRGGGTTIGNYDLFNRLAVQVTGQKDAEQAVKMIQEVLVNLGYSVKRGETDSGFGPGKGMVPSTKFKSVGIDGKVGEGTQGAVIRFQKANGLKPDGIVGPNTYAKLISVAKGGDPVKQAEKDPSKKVTTSDAKKAVKDIYAIIKQLNDSPRKGGHQHIINAYVEVRRNIVTQLMRLVGKGDDRGDSSSQIGSEENLKKLVANVFPSFPAGANRTEKKDFAIKIFINLPHKIKNSSLNTIHIAIDAQELLDMSIETLIKHSKDNLAVPDARETEKETSEARQTEKTTSEGYSIDFSKWLKTF